MKYLSGKIYISEVSVYNQGNILICLPDDILRRIKEKSGYDHAAGECILWRCNKG